MHVQLEEDCIGGCLDLKGALHVFAAAVVYIKFRLYTYSYSPGPPCMWVL